MTTLEDRLLLQADWFHALRQSSQSETIWSGFKKGKDKGHYVDLKREEGVLRPTSHDSCVVAQQVTARTVRVESNVDSAVSTVFVAPLAEWKSLHGGGVVSLDVSAKGLGVSAAQDASLFVWSTEDAAIQRKLEGHLLDVYKCRLFPSGLVVLSGGCDMQLKVWSVETGQCARTLLGHTQAILDVAIVDVGKDVLSGSKDGSCKLWNVGSGVCLTTFDPVAGPVNSIALDDLTNLSDPSIESEVCSNGKRVAMATETGKCFLYDLQSRELCCSLSLEGAANAVVFGAEGYLYCGTEHGVIVQYDTRNRSVIHSRQTGRGAVEHLHYSQKFGLLSSYNDGSVCVLGKNLEAKSAAFELSGPDCDAVYDFALNDKCLFSACKDKVVRKYLLSDISC